MPTRSIASSRLPAAGLGTAFAAAAVVAVIASVLAPGAPVRQALGRAETGTADVIVLLFAVGGELVPAPVTGSATAVVGDAVAPVHHGRPEAEIAVGAANRMVVAHLDLPPPRA